MYKLQMNQSNEWINGGLNDDWKYDELNISMSMKIEDPKQEWKRLIARLRAKTRTKTKTMSTGRQ